MPEMYIDKEMDAQTGKRRKLTSLRIGLAENGFTLSKSYDRVGSGSYYPASEEYVYEDLKGLQAGIAKCLRKLGDEEDVEE